MFSQRNSCTNLARSMFGGVCDTYCRHLAVSGLVTERQPIGDTTDLLLTVLHETATAAESKEDELCCVTPCSSAASTSSEPATTAADLQHQSMLPTNGAAQMPEAICIVADTNDWTVKVYQYKCSIMVPFFMCSFDCAGDFFSGQAIDRNARCHTAKPLRLRCLNARSVL